MKRRKVHITLFAEADEVDFYAIQHEGQESETKKFFNEFSENAEFKDDIDAILTRIGHIGDSGAEDRHFRYAGRMDDNAMELPNNMEYSKLRLYCLRLTTNIVILGNGGEKETRTYNEDDWLNSCVEDLQTIDEQIQTRIAKGEIIIDGKALSGNLTFYI